MKNTFYLLLGSFFLLGCSSPSTEENTSFLGGQIIQPSSEFISLYKYNKRIDSIRLDENNRFTRRYDSLDYGLFKLEHLPENELLILEKGDSIWTRINTADFDASLVYSGRGAAKNNFLMEIVLGLKKEVGFLASKYALNSDAFNQIIDSLTQEKKQRWIYFSDQSNLSPFAQKVTQAAYVYPYANRRERYALIRGKENVLAQDSTYFDFRNFLNYGEIDLAFYEPYVNYMLSYLSQEALEEEKTYFQQRNTTAFNLRRLQKIDETINSTVLRNNLARAVAYEELIQFQNHENHEAFLQYYFQLNSSPDYLSEIAGLHRALQFMQKGQPLPPIELQKNNEDILSSTSLRGMPTIYYFWSQTQMNHYSRTQQKIKAYQEAYPNYRFVGICIQPYNDLMREYQRAMQIDPTNQFALVDFEQVSKIWMITLLNKGIITDKNGNILQGFGNIFSKAFTEDLKRFHP